MTYWYTAASNFYVSLDSTATTASTGGVYYWTTVTTKETEAQKATREESWRVAEQQAKEREAKRLTAEQVAQKLIEDVFGKERLEEYRASKRVTIDSPEEPGRRYVIAAGELIKVYEGDKLVDELCLHLHDERLANDRAWLPDADIVVGKALLLLNDEDRTLALANHRRR